LELPPDASAGDDPDATATIRYFFERVRVTGNDKTSRAVIARYVPLQRGDVLDVNDPTIETIRFRLIGTGWFNDVRLSLERGTRRGWVVLVVEVRERNTIVVQQVVGGLSRVVGSRAGSTQVFARSRRFIAAVVAAAPHRECQQNHCCTE
jgi:outer membrane translocation and assembly module TamA